MAEHIGSVTSREEKFIQKGDNKGQPFLKVTLEPDKWTYSLFDGQHIKTAKQSNSLKITWEEDGKFRNVTDVQAVEGQQAVELANVVQSNQEFQRWQSCEVTAREIMCVLLNSSQDSEWQTKDVIALFQEFYRAVRTEVDGVVLVSDTPDRSPEDEGQIKRDYKSLFEKRIAGWTEDEKIEAIKECADKNLWNKNYVAVVKRDGLMGLTTTQLRQLSEHVHEQSRASAHL